MKYWYIFIIQKALAILKWVLHSKVEITFSFPFSYILSPPHPHPQEIYINSWVVDSGVRVTCFSQDSWMVFHISKPTIRVWKYYFVSKCLKLPIFKIKLPLFTLNYYTFPLFLSKSHHATLPAPPLQLQMLRFGAECGSSRPWLSHNCPSQSLFSTQQSDHNIFQFSKVMISTLLFSTVLDAKQDRSLSRSLSEEEEVGLQCYWWWRLLERTKVKEPGILLQYWEFAVWLLCCSYGKS